MLLEAERCAIRTWSENLWHDPREGPPLQEEIEHEAWFVELLSRERDGEVTPARHFVRGEPGDAPLSTNNRFNDAA